MAAGVLTWGPLTLVALLPTPKMSASSLEKVKLASVSDSLFPLAS